MSEKKNEELQLICRVIDQTVRTEQIYLFGSYAYGTPGKDSDYDLYVVIPDGSIRPVDAAVAIRRALYPVQRHPMDVIVSPRSRFLQRQKGPTLERKIAREGVLLYGQQRELEQRMA
jgi:predicted nucleotidyltransferase